MHLCDNDGREPKEIFYEVRKNIFGWRVCIYYVNSERLGRKGWVVARANEKMRDK